MGSQSRYAEPHSCGTTCPITMTATAHPEHEVVLLHTSKMPLIYYCNICHTNIQGSFYHCNYHCNFDAHPHCITPTSSQPPPYSNQLLPPPPSPSCPPWHHPPYPYIQAPYAAIPPPYYAPPPPPPMHVPHPPYPPPNYINNVGNYQGQGHNNQPGRQSIMLGLVRTGLRIIQTIAINAAGDMLVDAICDG